MNLYNLIMSIGGAMVLVGIFLTCHLSWNVEKLRFGTRKISWLILFGGVLTSLGFAGVALGIENTGTTFLIFLGPAFILYAVSESGLVRAKPEMLIQVALITGSLALSKDLKMGTIESLSALAIVILIDALAFYVYTPERYSKIARLSAWLFTLFVPLNAALPGNPLAMLLYIVSIGLWVVILIKLMGVLRERLLKTVPQGL